MSGSHLKTVILQEYNELINGIFLYQEQQVELRFICIKLVLGAFAIIGALTIYNIGLSNDWLLGICSLLPLLSLAPLTGILMNDLFLRERLKMSYYTAALDYENKHPWLPEEHPLMGPESETRHYLGAKQTSFYFGCTAVMLAISCFFFLLFRDNYTSYSSITLILLSYAVIYGAYIKLVDNRLREITKTAHVHKHKKKKKFQIDESIASIIHIKWKEYIQHFSKIKMRYKSSLMVVMSAVVIAYIYILQTKANYSHINKIYLITFMTILAVIGSNLIRMLDLRVSHSQLEHLVGYSAELESAFKCLPKPFVEIKHLSRGKRSFIFLDFLHTFLYYFLFNLSMLSFAFITLFAQAHPPHSLFLPVIVLAFMLLWEALAFIRLLRKSVR